jgi:hypothetical protein
VYNTYRKRKGEKKMKNYPNPNNLSAMTDEEIKSAIEALTNEVKYRKRQKEAKLIENFRNAWYDLNSSGITVSYAEEEEDMEICLIHWDGFNFN